MRTRSVSTMHELLHDLENLCCKQGEEFESLQIGPLQSQPVIYTPLLIIICLNSDSIHQHPVPFQAFIRQYCVHF